MTDANLPSRVDAKSTENATVTEIAAPRPHLIEQSPVDPVRGIPPAVQAEETDLQLALLKCATSPEFERWVANTLGRRGEEFRSMVIESVELILDSPAGKAKPGGEVQLRRSLRNAALRCDAELRFLERIGDDLDRFLHAPCFVAMAEVLFHHRDFDRDGGDVTKDQRYVRAVSETYLAALSTAIVEGAPPGEHVHPPKLMWKLLCRYARMRPERFDIDRPVQERSAISFEDWMACAPEPVDCVGYEAAYPCFADPPSDEAEAEAEWDPVSQSMGFDLEPVPFSHSARMMLEALTELPPGQALVLQATLEETPSKALAKQVGRSVSTIDNSRRQARLSVIARCIERMGRKAFWEDLPDHWKTAKTIKFIEDALKRPRRTKRIRIKRK